MTQNDTPTIPDMAAPTSQRDVLEVIDTLADAMSGLWPNIPADKMRSFGSALSNVFELFTRIGASNVLPFAAQTEINRQDIETIRGQIADQRTVTGDLMNSRDEIETRLDAGTTRLTADEARIATLEARIDQLEQRVDRLATHRVVREGDRGE